MITTAGKTDVSVYFYIVQDASATSPGEPVTGLLFSDIETGGSASYARQGAARVDLTLITLASASATHADGGFILVDDTNMPGLYRCDYEDAAFATGVDQVMLQIVVASGKNAVASPIFVEITDVDLRDSVRGGMTALPNAAADAAGGLAISDLGGLDLDDIPITSEFEARTLAAASYFDPSTDQVLANLTQVNGNVPPVTNFELMYDGTGYIDDTAPSSRSQVNNISVTGGGAVNFNPDGDNVGGALKGITFVGVETSGTFSDTFTLNSVFHQIDDAANEIDIVYSVDITAVNIATGVVFDGFLNSANDEMNVMAFDFVGSAFEQIEVIPGQGGSGNEEISAPLLSRHTGTSGADIGKVFIRIQNTGQTNPTLNTDRLIVQAVSNITSLGFESGAVWLNTISGTSGTAAGVGFVDNPSDNLIDTLAIATANNLAKIEVLSGSSDIFPSSMDKITMNGRGYTMAMDGQSCASARFNNGTFSGLCTGAPSPLFTGCLVNSSTMPTFTVCRECTINGTYTMGEAGTFIFFECNQGGATGPVIDFAAFGASTARLIKWGGEVEFQNMATGDVVILTGDGKFTVNANCTGGTIRVYGTFPRVDNSGGAVTFEEIGRLDLDAIQAKIINDATPFQGADIAATLDDTGEIGLAGAGLTDLGGMSTAMKAEILVEVVKLLTTQMIESYAADGTAPTLAQALMLIQQSIHEFAIVTTTRTVKKLDGSTTAATFTLDDDTNPTSTTRAT